MSNSPFLICRATTPGQSVTGNYENEGVLRIPQRYIITAASPTDISVPYPGHWLGGSLTEVMQLVYSITPADSIFL